MDFTYLDDSALMAVIARSFGKSPSDAALNEAVSILYDRYGHLVYSVAVHIVGDLETAEEITQDVFVRACNGAASYNADFSKVSSWLVSITRHRAIDELRRRSARPEKDGVALSDDFALETPGHGGPEMGLEGEVDISLQEQNIHRVLTILPPDQRKVLELAYFKGLTHQQIASLTGEPLGTIKSRLRLGMQKLREALIEQGIKQWT